MTQLTPKEILEWLNPGKPTNQGAYRQIPKHVLVQAAALIEKLLLDAHNAFKDGWKAGWEARGK